MPGGSTSASYSQAKSYSKPWSFPSISDVSNWTTATYLRDLPKIVALMQRFTPELVNTYLQSAAPIQQQGISNLRDILGLEREAQQQQAAQNLGLYSQYESPLQMLQAQTQLATERMRDPEYFAQREATGRGLSDLLNPNLSGSELSAIERGLNRQFSNAGTFNIPSNVQQLQAASAYGGGARNRIAQGVSAATQALPQFKYGTTTPIVKTQPRQISEAFAKPETEAAQKTAQGLFYNPVEEASQAYRTVLGIPESGSKSMSIAGGLGCGT